MGLFEFCEVLMKRGLMEKEVISLSAAKPHAKCCHCENETPRPIESWLDRFLEPMREVQGARSNDGRDRGRRARMINFVMTPVAFGLAGKSVRSLYF
jgi:hypothetical protein